jgi:Glycosyltransferase 61
LELNMTDFRYKVIYSAQQAAEQVPLWGEARTDPFIVAQHYRHKPNGDVRVYFVSGFTLFGYGLLRAAGSFLYLEDCYPGYLSAGLRGSDRLPDVWAANSYQEDVGSVFVEKPCGVFLHPNYVYGHALLEMLPRLFLLRKIADSGYEMKIPLPMGAPAWLREMVSIYFAEEDIIYFDEKIQSVRAPEYVVPSMMHEDHNFHPSFNECIDDTLKRTGAGRGSGRRVFISRSKIPSRDSERFLGNAIEIEGAMTELGFEIIRPEEFSFREQVEIFSEADFIVGEFSSALHNSLFSPRGVVVVSLNWINWYQSNIGRLRAQRIAYIPPDDGIWRDWRREYLRNGMREFNVSPRVICDMIADISNLL